VNEIDRQFPSEAEIADKFGDVDVWIFDLDNTLYPARSGLWREIDMRITHYLASLHGLDGLSARAMQRFYRQRDGATLRGLMNDGFERLDEFLTFVHDIDRSALEPDPELQREICRLPGRRFVFTNGSKGHAVETLARLGLEGVFEDSFDIKAAEFVPKPEAAAYDAFLRRYDVDPRRAAMFEDLALNLEVPKARGMTTTLVLGSAEAGASGGAVEAGGRSSAADFQVVNLPVFLARVNRVLSAR